MREPTKLPLMTEQEKERIIIILEAFLQYATDAKCRLELIPADVAPDFVQNNVKYWKNVRSGFKWMLGLVKRRLTNEQISSRSGTHTTSKLLSSGGSEQTIDAL